MKKRLRDRALRLRYLTVWKVRELRGRATFVILAARESATTFTRIAAMRPIMGGSPEPGDGGGEGGGGNGGGEGGGAGGGAGGVGGEGDPPKPKADPPTPNQVGEAKRLQKKAEKEAKEAQEKVEELEGANSSETEKERAKREKAERERDETNERLKSLERGGWVRTAAKAAGAIDDDVIVALVNLDDATDESTAEQLVKELAEKKPKLFGQRGEGGGGAGGNGGFGTPQGGTQPGGGSPGGALPGIGADGKVDQAEVRKGLGQGLLGLIRGGQQAGTLPGGEPPDDED